MPDLAIVGAGFGGLAAACRAVELGLRPVVLEKGEDADYPCNSRVSGGFVHIALRDPTDPPEELAETIAQLTGGFADPGITTALTGDARRVVTWLKNQGARFIRVGARPVGHYVMAPPRTVQSGLSWKGRGPDQILRSLTDRVLSGGGERWLGARATGLVMAGGRCRGVQVMRRGEAVTLAADNVVIADGGFQSDLELVGRYISPRPDRLLQRNVQTGMGDGLRMAEAAGAKLVGMECFYGHLMSLDAFANDQLWPYPQMDGLAIAGMVVDRSGRRVVDEGRGGTFMANMLARRADPADCFAVFDEAIWRGPGADLSAPPAVNPTLRTFGGTIHSGASIAEVAGKAGIDPAALSATVEAYNAALAAGRLDGLDPPRLSGGGQSVAIKKAMPIAKPPFHAVPICAGITYTMGGPATDGDARVLDRAGAAIPGLYAVGTTAGGLEGGPRAGYVGGIAKAVAMGLRAAEHVRGRHG